ncbi:MAG: tail fiber domain-containing protein [Candidatus Nanoarchaeia archaeon]|nr:tail fiber domain-containing protein [Candidatus Nanoarchaeia archaeon]
MDRRGVLLIIILSVLCLSIISAEIPQKLNIHGRLTNSAGTAVSGAHNIVFKIYNIYSGGVALWNSGSLSVTSDSDGIYDVILNATNLNFNEQYYLGITVEADSEMTPRINLTSSPYAFRANVTDFLNSSSNYEMQNLTLGQKITFAFGEIIDNIVDGMINIAGNLNVVGDINATGLIYGNGSQLTGISSTSGGSGVPTGAISAFNLVACPTGWVLADGTGGTPDLRGIFVRGSGTSGILNMSNRERFSAVYGTYANDSFLNHTHSVYGGFGAEGSGTFRVIEEALNGLSSEADMTSQVGTALAGAESEILRRGAETTPAYYATIYCVKTGEDTPVSNSIWGASGSNIILQNTSKNLVINNTNFVINTTSGNVGIGTSSPTQLLTLGATNSIIATDTADGSDTKNLEITGGGGISASRGAYAILYGNEAAAGSKGKLVLVSGQAGDATLGDSDISITAGSQSIPSLYIQDSSGNVGIGTTSPNATLNVNASNTLTRDLLLVKGGGTSGNFGFRVQASNGDPLFFVNTLSYNVGIGTASPTSIGANYKSLDIEGPNGGGVLVSNTNGATQGVLYADGVGGVVYMGSTTSHPIYFLTNNVNVGAFTVSGDFYTNDGTVHSLSDIRLKNFIGNFTPGLDEIMQLSPAIYSYKIETNNTDLPMTRDNFVGLSAQEVQKVIPEAVDEDENGYLSLTTGPINYAMLNAIKELKTENDNLKKALCSHFPEDEFCE